ncbi:periplasmic heavy metal sensor [Pedobacter metabolipauper]|uniref:Heavy-metal resistance protein n=1 Tax=Pedobacter metabolipauper TaxID=425513 RepID=A0A4R6ST71_9SPHI|nr:periplasmic heavy metal sensor [Pedobacter metabolipauper]TDQ08527.1 heavy-metal resistance protein [Pedobacter metabolipauper]
MKKLLMICALLFSVITFAQAQQGQGGGRMGGTPEERAKRSTDMLAEKLKLTDDQKAKVSALYLEQGEKSKKLREEAGDDRDAMRAAMVKSNEELETKITALLTADQKKAFTAWQEERKEMMKKRQEGGGPRPGGR